MGGVCSLGNRLYLNHNERYIAKRSGARQVPSAIPSSPLSHSHRRTELRTSTMAKERATVRSHCFETTQRTWKSKQAETKRQKGKETAIRRRMGGGRESSVRRRSSDSDGAADPCAFYHLPPRFSRRGSTKLQPRRNSMFSEEELRRITRSMGYP